MDYKRKTPEELQEYLKMNDVPRTSNFRDLLTKTRRLIVNSLAGIERNLIQNKIRVKALSLEEFQDLCEAQNKYSKLIEMTDG